MLVYWKTMQREKSKVKLYIPYVGGTHVQFEIRLWLFDSQELIKLQQKKKKKKERKKNTELINANQKPSKSDNLKYNKWPRKRAKNTGKTILTRSGYN